MIMSFPDRLLGLQLPVATEVEVNPKPQEFKVICVRINKDGVPEIVLGDQMACIEDVQPWLDRYSLYEENERAYRVIVDLRIDRRTPMALVK